jgi:4-hydroxybenzoate polyprenyltransferase
MLRGLINTILEMHAESLDKLFIPYMLHAPVPALQLLRGAGCTVNDLWDRNIDRQVWG